jgi:hypothetical protein
MGYIVTTEAAKVYKVRFVKEGEEPHRFGWADAAVRTFPRGGSISIQSDYGTYANTWTATGDGPFIEFLCQLDFDYFMTKTRGRHHVFDHERSMKAIRRSIIERRRSNDITAADARDVWDDLEQYGSDGGPNADFWFSEIMRSDAISRFFDGDYFDIVKEVPDPECVGFWNEIWPHLVTAWRAELASKVAA